MRCPNKGEEYIYLYVENQANWNNITYKYANYDNQAYLADYAGYSTVTEDTERNIKDAIRDIKEILKRNYTGKQHPQKTDLQYWVTMSCRDALATIHVKSGKDVDSYVYNAFLSFEEANILRDKIVKVLIKYNLIN